MTLNRQDRETLRALASEVAAIAALPDQQHKIGLWQRLNGLRPERPMVMIEQVPWHEMNVADELTLRTSDPGAREVETRLRRTLYRWRHLRGDLVVEARLEIPPAVSGMSYGIEVDEERSVADALNDVMGHAYHDQLAREEDVDKIRPPEIRHDKEETARRTARWREVFDGLLEVEPAGITPVFNLWDQIVCWRGAGTVLMDLAERPEHMHRIVKRTTEAFLAGAEQLEALGLLSRANRWIHCTGAFTDELPAPGGDPDRARLRDVWACGMAQIFCSVSPAMHREFELDYVKPLYGRCGLIYYGCCEPLHKALPAVRTIPNLRKISMSPWVDQEEAAAGVGPDFVFSRKPSPALLAVEDWNPAAVEKDLQSTLDICARHGCPLELILKDISTVRYRPKRLWEWADIAMRLVGG